MSKKHIFDKKENVKKLLLFLFIGCAVMLSLDLLFVSGKADKHAYFEWENFFGFYPVYGFIACVSLVLIAKHILRPLVMRDEDYYDES